MKVALYLRVSTDKQEADNQRMQLRQLCQAQGWRIVRESRIRKLAAGLIA